MFLQNKYSKWYYSIIENAKTKTIEGYKEKHHIIPKSLGGTNDKHNIVSLTAREHFICHLLLIRMTVGKERIKMVYAAWFFNGNKKYKTDFKINNRIYESLKIERSINQKMRIVSKEEKDLFLIGHTKAHVGRVCSEETKNKISNSNLGKKRSNITKQRLVLAHANMSEEAKNIRSEKMKEKAKNRKPMSDETKEKCASFHRGRKRSEETKQKQREAQMANLCKVQIVKNKPYKLWLLENDKGEILKIENLKSFALENSINLSTLYKTEVRNTRVAGYRIIGKENQTHIKEVYKR